MHHSIYRSFLLEHKCSYHPTSKQKSSRSLFILPGVFMGYNGSQQRRIHPQKKIAFPFPNRSVTLKNTFNDITSCGTDAEGEVPIPSVAEGNLTQDTIDEHDCSKAERDDRGKDMTCGAFLQTVFTDIMSFLGMTWTRLQGLSLPVSCEYIHVTRHTRILMSEQIVSTIIVTTTKLACDLES